MHRAHDIVLTRSSTTSARLSRLGQLIAVLQFCATLGCNALLSIDDARLCDDDCDAGSAPLSYATLGPAQTPYETAEEATSTTGSAEPKPAAPLAGSKVDLGASCSAMAPALAHDCASCGGQGECDGSCSVPTPPNLGQPCGSCGGATGCDGSCSVQTPPNFDEACGSCGGSIDCNGTCSVATPSDYGSMMLRDSEDGFLCCFIDETRSYGPDGRDDSGCYPGYTYAGCTVSKVVGLGSVSITSEDPASCTCQVRVQNTGLDGAKYAVHIRLTRGCN